MAWNIEDCARIQSRANERVKRAAAWMNSASARRADRMCVAPGLKLCEEAAKEGLLRELWMVDEVWEREQARIEPLLRPPVRAAFISRPVADKLGCGQQSSQGLIGLVSLRAARFAAGPEAADWLRGKQRVLALCNVQDPGNVGTALRTATALGYAAAFGPGCADPYSSKALRASMGAAFRGDTAFFDDELAFVEAVRRAGLRPVAAALTDKALPVTGIGRGEPLALFIGHEGKGLARETIDACDCAAVIPICDRVESLNAAAAAAIAMWELRP